MGGGILQLVARGVQDNFIINDPEITYFKLLHRRHTSFACESIPQKFNDIPKWGSQCTCTISKVGDLVGKMYVNFRLPYLPHRPNVYYSWNRYIGFAMIKEIILDIGGEQIDKHYGEWLYIWHQVTTKQEKLLDKMVGNIPELYEYTKCKNEYDLFIPLIFWFNKYDGSAFPIGSISADMKITVVLRDINECLVAGASHSIEIKEDVVPYKVGEYIIQRTSDNNTGIVIGQFISFDYFAKRLYYNKLSRLSDNKQFTFGRSIFSATSGLMVNPAKDALEIVERDIYSKIPETLHSKLYATYRYLSFEERALFNGNMHEYVIEQLQLVRGIDGRSGIRQVLNFDHPCRAIYWTARLYGVRDIFNYTNSYLENTKKGLIIESDLLLNNVSMFQDVRSDFTEKIQIHKRHSRTPDAGINCYIYDLNIESWQSAGTCNMSKIDQQQMLIRVKLDEQIKKIDRTFTNGALPFALNVYALNYNVMRIGFRSFGLAFR